MLILASASPRRKEIMEKLGLRFHCDPADVDETLPSDISAANAAEYLALKKANAVLSRHADSVIVGSDTVVVVDDCILGKPKDSDDAAKMLRRISGRRHTVYTGVAIASKAKTESFTCAAEVEFDTMTQQEISWYVATGEPMGKAGAYAIQGLACRFIKGIDGDYYSVMGLPANMLYKRLEDFDLGDK